MAVRNQPSSLGGLPIQIDYTARDFEAIRAELLSLATQLTPEWTDREAGDIGVTILEAVSYVADILSYQLDRVQNESYLTTAQTREAVVDLLRLINYEMAPASPATVAMTIQTNEDNVTLPVGFTVKTKQDGITVPQEYSLTQAITLPVAGYYCVDYQEAKVTRIFGQTPAINNNLIFVAGDAVSDAVGTSNGTADQAFYLPSYPVCISSDGFASISVTVDGELYEARTTFIGSDPDDAIFVYRFDAEQRAIIRFGDGVNGKIPVVNGAIIANYRINGGLETNRAGVGSITDFDFIQGVTQVYNVSSPSGGSDPETIVEAKKKGPMSLRALDRCVTLEDYEVLAMLTEGGSIRAAKAVQGDTPLTVDLYIAVQGDDPTPSGKWYESLQSGYGIVGAVGRWINEKKPVPSRVNILPPVAIKPYFEATVYLQANLLQQLVAYEVDLVLQQLFNEVTNDFGENIPLSKILQVIENTRGVNYVDAKAFHRFPQARYVSGSELAFEGATVSVTGMAEQMTANTYTILWVGYNTYRLRKRDNSFVVGEDKLPVTYTAGATYLITELNFNPSDNEPSQRDQFSLSISLGPDLPKAGNMWEFTVDDYLGNINARNHEIVVAPIDAKGRLFEDNVNLTFIGGI